MATPVIGFESIDMGTFGPVFSVEEENMILALKRKLKLLEEAGKLDALKEQWTQKIKENFKRPKSVEGIVRTVEERSFHHDPTLVIEHDIQSPKGDYLKILYNQGLSLDGSVFIVRYHKDYRPRVNEIRGGPKKSDRVLRYSI